MDQLLDAIQMYRRLREACDAAGGQTAWARKHGLSESSVSDIARARRNPTPAFLAALGLREVRRYQVITPKPPASTGDPDAGPSSAA